MMTMAHSFASLRDVLRIAAEFEQQAAAFWDDLAKSAVNQDLAGFAQHVANEEREHADYLTALQDQAGKTREPKPGDEAIFRHLAEIFGRSVPGGHAGGRLQTEFRTSRDAARIASGFEREAILMWHAIRQLVPDEEHGTVQEIIEEEERHVGRLDELAGF